MISHWPKAIQGVVLCCVIYACVALVALCYYVPIGCFIIGCYIGVGSSC